LKFKPALWAVLAAAFVLRCWRLDFFSYGLDEIVQVYFVQGDWSFFWKKLRFDAVHPPLDYLVTRAVEALHPADWVRKLPAVLWGTGAIAALALLLRRRAGDGVALMSALLLALAPFHVRYSQELRPYSLGLLLLCLSLLALDLFLDRPTWVRLFGLFLACLATAYTLYLAAVVLGIAALGLLLDEAFSEDSNRRRAARRFLAWSPLFLLALFLAYLPWVPVVLEAARRPPFWEAPPLTFERLTRFLSFFSFAPGDGQPLGRKGPLYVGLVALGLALSVRARATRFLAVWLLAGCAAIEVLEQTHPHWYVTRHYLAAGLVFPALAALALVHFFRIHRTRVLAAAVAALVVLFDFRSLAVYYREGRPDWRTLGRALRARPASEKIFTENWYTALCVAFYTVGPDYLYRRGHTVPEVVSIEGQAVRLAWSWPPGTTAWLVLGGSPPSEELRQWSSFFPAQSFPKAEDATLLRLDPSLWGRMAETVPRPAGK
jgi:4-amino-4-deoxy-L-arabinose transferase-like glycosyltransferase